jgi:PAS domain S-box-containing protein
MAENLAPGFPIGRDPPEPSSRPAGRLAQGWANRSLRTKGLTVVAIPLLALLFVAPVYYLSQRRAEEASAWVVHTLEVGNQIDRVQNLSQGASLGIRGYLLTGSREFLDRYRASVQALPPAVQRLRALTSDNPSQQQHLARLETAYGEFLDDLEHLKNSYDAHGLTRSQGALVSRTRLEVDSLQSVLDAMRAEEDRLLLDRREEASRANDLSAIAVGISIPLALFVGLGAMLLFTTGVSRRVQQLAANATLLQREEPLLPVPAAEDEIGHLGRALQEAADLLEERRGALAMSEERYRTLARNLPNGIVAMFDGDLRYTMAEGPALDTLGIRGEDLEGKTIWETSPPDIVEILEPVYREALAGRTSVREIQVRGRTLLSHYLPVEGGGGALAAGMVVSLDITQRKEAEEEALRLQSFLNSVVENIPNMIFVKDADRLAFVRFNRAGEELLGVSRSELIGKNDYDLFPKEEADFFTTKDREVLSSGTLLDIPEEPIEAVGGERILHTKKIPILNEAGEPEYLLGISEDITEQKQADDLLQEAKREAERANRAKSEFLSRISHELRTPLNAILGFGQLLETAKLRPEDSESVHHILKGGRHLLDLINEVLDISRIDARELSLSIEAVSGEEAVIEATDLILPLAAQRSIEVDVVHADASLMVMADHQRLKQVLLNLLSNAVKYNREGGRVTVRILRSEGCGRIEIEDTGPGIAPEDMPRLFKAFDRLGAETGNVEGSGLGLSLTGALVEAMNGRLQVESEPGAGSTFAVEFPLAHEEPASAIEGEPSSGRDANESVPKRTVLFIEDNLSNLRLVERILSVRPDIKMIAAMQGRLGVQLARDHHPDVVLLDLDLPDIQGEEALAQLRELRGGDDLPVIVTSAEDGHGHGQRNRGRLTRLGATGFVFKPIRAQALLEAVDEVMPPAVHEEAG